MIQIDEPFASWMMLSARVCLAGVYLVSGLHKAIWYREAVAEFRDDGVAVIGLLLPATIALHLLGSLALLSGWYVRELALALAVFTVLATVKVHGFWRMHGEERLIASRIAMANLAVVGGLILLAAVGPGRLVL